MIAKLGPAFDNAADILIQEDGKLIVIGCGTQANTNAFVISRYNLDGSIDESFGNGGYNQVLVGDGVNYASKGAFQSNGSIIFSGRSKNGDYEQFTCLRFHENGQ